MGRATGGWGVPAAGAQPGESVELVRRLIRVCLDGEEPDSFEHYAGKRVLVDIEVDGVRFQLIRVPVKAERCSISPREQEIARMVAKGYPNKAIAAVLDVSSWTVGTHLRRIYLKLGVGSRAAMVKRLSDFGLLEDQRDAGYRRVL